jgi:hypothetical protein
MDYAFVGSVFSVPNTASVVVVFSPGPDLSVLEMCVLNGDASRVYTLFELSPA